MFWAASNRTPKGSYLENDTSHIQPSLEVAGMGMNSGAREMTILQLFSYLLNAAASQMKNSFYSYSRYHSPRKAIKKGKGGQ